MRHQELHLVRQDTAVAQNEVFPQARHIGRVEQRHMRLLGRAAALAVVAGAASRDHVHPGVYAVLGKGNNVFTRQIALVEMAAAVSADIAVANKELAVGQARAQIERVDVGHATGADDAVDVNDGLQPGARVVSAVEHRDFAADFPAHFVRGVMRDRLFQRNPGLG